MHVPKGRKLPVHDFDVFSVSRPWESPDGFIVIARGEQLALRHVASDSLAATGHRNLVRCSRCLVPCLGDI
jgi:hypothetical protein